MTRPFFFRSLVLAGALALPLGLATACEERDDADLTPTTGAPTYGTPTSPTGAPARGEGEIESPAYGVDRANEPENNAVGHESDSAHPTTGGDRDTGFDADFDADVNVPDVDVPEVNVPDVNLPDVDVDADVKASEDGDSSASSGDLTPND